MRRMFFLLVAVCGLVGSAPSASAPVRPAQAAAAFEQITALVTQKMAEYSVPGVALGMFKDGQITARGFGVTNLDDPQPITPDTIFPLASISKTVAATAIMRLVEQGKIDLRRRSRRYLPTSACRTTRSAAK